MKESDISGSAASILVIFLKTVHRESDRVINQRSVFELFSGFVKTKISLFNRLHVKVET